MALSSFVYNSPTYDIRFDQDVIKFTHDYNTVTVASGGVSLRDPTSFGYSAVNFYGYNVQLAYYAVSIDNHHSWDAHIDSNKAFGAMQADKLDGKPEIIFDGVINNFSPTAYTQAGIYPVFEAQVNNVVNAVNPVACKALKCFVTGPVGMALIDNYLHPLPEVISNFEIANSTPEILSANTPSLLGWFASKGTGVLDGILGAFSYIGVKTQSAGALTAEQSKLILDWLIFANDSTLKYGFPVVLPEYGNYGGLRWTAGQRDFEGEVPATEEDAKNLGVALPIDKLDLIFLKHDYAYSNSPNDSAVFNADLALIISCIKLEFGSEPLSLKQHTALALAVEFFIGKNVYLKVASQSRL